MQLIVVGMHRSGTSVLARLVNLMGVYFGAEGVATNPNRENPKGFWERRDVRLLNDQVLHSVGCDWNRLSEFDLRKLPAQVAADFQKKAFRIVLDMDAHRPWMMKEPRLCLLLPLWRQVLELPVCIYIIRHPVEVAASLKTRNDIPIAAGLALWERYNRSALESMGGLPRITVFHDALIDDPEGVVGTLHAQLSALHVPLARVPSKREIDAFVSKELHRQRRDHPDLAAYATAAQVKLFNKWKTAGEASVPASARLATRDLKALVAYEASLPPLNVEPAPQKPSVETELRQLIAARDKDLRQRDKQAALYEQEIRLQGERFGQAQKELERMQQQLAFVEQEFAQLRVHAVDVSNAAQRERERWAGDLAREQEIARSAADRVRELQARLEASEGAYEAAAATLADREARITGLVGKLERSEKQREEREAAMASELAAARMAAQAAASEMDRKLSARYSEIERLTRMLAAEELTHQSALRARDQLQSEVARMDKRRRELEGEIGVGTEAVRRLERERTRLETLLATASERGAALQEALDEAVACLEADKSYLHSILGSTSWRATGPLRRFKRLLAGRATTSSIVFGADVMRLRGSELFDATWYLSTYADVASSGLDPASHYLACGAREGRDPGPGFSTAQYLALNPDVASTGINPLVHFLSHGMAEGRQHRAPMQGSGSND